ncbi:competence type IV pilus ATPase ComGA [Bacillus piscicola]|uniref:competence type IV pilus ATPase ComGA n=1 Tax=Bacillus piscicola TaxID=1632684 RepID=UPI001F09E15E|nr:competence type IV pilus ATPase ComGA [Bacillus piscicola]
MSNVELDSRTIVDRALELQATDVHLHPYEKVTVLLFRIHGDLYKMATLRPQTAERLIAHFKFRAGMDIGEKRRPQNGSFLAKSSRRPVNLRFSTMPSYYRESMSIRLLPQKEFLSLSSLSFSPAVVSYFQSLLSEKNGLIILTGPTGSGKTTTLYSFMNALSKQYASRIISIEDPVEIRDESFIQTEVNEKAGLSYAEMLKSSLRHDPDVIMIGEIRDTETAKLAIRAAFTGHLVFTTMHAGSPYGAIHRLQDFGFTNVELQETLLCITSQTLLQRYCVYCQGFTCSPYCQKFKQASRLALFDILSKREILQYFANHFQDKPALTISQQTQLIKGKALGLL